MYFYNRNFSFVCLYPFRWYALCAVRALVWIRSVDSNLFARTFPKPNRFIIHEYVTLGRWLLPDQTPNWTHCVRRKSTTSRNMCGEQKCNRDVKPTTPHVQFASIFMFISSSGCRRRRFPLFHLFFSFWVPFSLLLICNSISFRAHESE